MTKVAARKCTNTNVSPIPLQSGFDEANSERIVCSATPGANSVLPYIPAFSYEKIVLPSTPYAL